MRRKNGETGAGDRGPHTKAGWRLKSTGYYPAEFRKRIAAEVVDHGVTAHEVSRVFGVAYTTIVEWVNRYRAGGAGELDDKPRVPPRRTVTKEVSGSSRGNSRCWTTGSHGYAMTNSSRRHGISPADYFHAEPQFGFAACLVIGLVTSGCGFFTSKRSEIVAENVQVSANWSELKPSVPLKQFHRFCDLEVDSVPPIVSPQSNGRQALDEASASGLTARLRDSAGRWHQLETVSVRIRSVRLVVLSGALPEGLAFDTVQIRSSTSLMLKKVTWACAPEI